MSGYAYWNGLLFTFQGRIHRAKFWLVWLAGALIFVIALLPASALALLGTKNACALQSVHPASTDMRQMEQHGCWAPRAVVG